MKICLILFIFIFSLGLLAQDKLPSQWGLGPLISHQQNGNIKKIKLFTRYVLAGQLSIPIVQTNFTYLKTVETHPDDSISKIAQNIKTSFSPVNWKINSHRLKNNGTKITLEGRWKHANRFYRIELLQTPQMGTAIIVTSIRQGFKNEIMKEVNHLHTLLQKSYETGDSQAQKTVFSPLFNLMFPDAHAIDLGGIISIIGDPAPNGTNDGTNNASGGGGIIGLLSSKDATANIDKLTKTLETSNENWADTNAQLPELNQTAKDMTEQMKDMNKNWADSNDIAKETNKQLHDANTNMANMNGELKGFNKNWERSNELMAMALDPVHMAMVGFGSAAGAALGSLAVNLLVDGVTKSVSIMVDLVTDASGKKERWDLFKAASENWDKQADVALELEKYLDAFINTFKTFEKRSGEDLLISLNKEKNELDFQALMLNKKINSPAISEDCARYYYFELTAIQETINNVNAALLFSKNQNMKTLKMDSNEFCHQLAAIKQKIIQASSALQKSRLDLLNGQTEWLETRREQIYKDRAIIQRLNDRSVAEKNKNLTNEVASMLFDESKQFKDRIPEDWYTKCWKAQNETGKKIAGKNTSNIFEDWRRMDQCKLAYAQLYKEIYASRDANREQLANQAEKEAQLLFNESNARLLEGNQNMALEEVNELISWMRRIRAESICFNELETSNTKVENKCKQVSSKLVSLYTSKKKAENAWSNICEKKMNQVYDDVYNLNFD